MFDYEILECLFTRSSCIATRLSVSQVCKHIKEYIDAHWAQLVTPGGVQTVYTMCKPVNVKVFVLTYNRFIKEVIKEEVDHSEDSAKQWTVSFQRRDKKWHRMYKFGPHDGNRVPLDGFAATDLFGEDDKAHVLVHLFREGDSKCAVLIDEVISNVLKVPTVYFSHDLGHHQVFNPPEAEVTVKISDNLEMWFYYIRSESHLSVWLEQPTSKDSHGNYLPFMELSLELHKILESSRTRESKASMAKKEQNTLNDGGIRLDRLLA